MILSRPYQDDDEMYEDQRLFREWAKKKFGRGDDSGYQEDDEYEPD